MKGSSVRQDKYLILGADEHFDGMVFIGDRLKNKSVDWISENC